MTSKADNISSFNERLSAQERTENARRAGQASGEARRRQVGLRDKIRLLMREPAKYGIFANSGLRTDDAIAAGIVMRALEGDEKCLARVLDVVGNVTDQEQDYALERQGITLEQRKNQDSMNDQIANLFSSGA